MTAPTLAGEPGETGASGETGETGSHAVERLAHQHPAVVKVARLGWVAKGVVYVLLGALAVPIALARRGQDDGGAGSDQASQTGAVARVAESSAGAFALWLIAVGLLLYVAWRIVSIVLPAENSAKATVTRVGYGVSAVTYLVVVATAITLARAGRSTAGEGGDEDARVEQFTRDLMERSAGRWLVGLIGVVVIAVGIFFAVRGITANFRKELEPRAVGPITHEAIVSLGRVGWVGRGLMMVVVGWFLVRAAVRFDADEAKGIDGALREAAGSTAGALLVGFVALALIVYGVFCIVSAPRARLRGAD